MKLKRSICIAILLCALLFVLPASAQDISASLGEMGGNLADAFKSFGSNLASASGALYESVKDTIADDGKEVVDGAVDAVKGWVKRAEPKVEHITGVIGDWAVETAPKVGDFFDGLWDKITKW